MTNFFRMHSLAYLGRIEEACALAGNFQDELAPLETAFKHALRREREPVLGLLTGKLKDFAWNDPETPELVAGWLSLVGEREKALDWLEHWIDRGSINYPMLAHGDPLLEPLRGEPRFQRLLARVRPEWESFIPRFQTSDWHCSEA